MIVMFSPDMKNRVLELNASDERGIDVGSANCSSFVGNSSKGCFIRTTKC